MIWTADCIRIAIEQHVLQYLFVILDSVSAIVSVVGNSLVLVAIWGKSRLHFPLNVLLAGLALSDLGVGLDCQPARSFTAMISTSTKMEDQCSLQHLFYILHRIFSRAFHFFP